MANKIEALEAKLESIIDDSKKTKEEILKEIKEAKLSKQKA